MLVFFCITAIFFLFLNPEPSLLNILSLIFGLVLLYRNAAIVAFCALLGFLISQFDASIFPMAIWLENLEIPNTLVTIKSVPILSLLYLEHPLVLSALLTSIFLSLLVILIYPHLGLKNISHKTQKLILKITAPFLSKTTSLLLIFLLVISTFIYLKIPMWVTNSLEKFAQTNKQVLKIQQLRLSPISVSAEKIFYQLEKESMAITLSKLNFNLNIWKLLERQILIDNISIKTLNVTPKSSKPIQDSSKKQSPPQNTSHSNTQQQNTQKPKISLTELTKYVERWQRYYPKIRRTINGLFNFYKTSDQKNKHYQLKNQYSFWKVGVGQLRIDQVEIDQIQLPIKKLKTTHDEKNGHSISIEIDDSIITNYIKEKAINLFNQAEKSSSNFLNNLFK